MDELHNLYDDTYFAEYPGGESYAADVAQRRFEAARRLHWIQKYVASGNLLEIGAAEGEFLDVVREAGYGVCGVEPASGLAEKARAARGLDVRTGFIEEVELPDIQFDAICMWHVLEHITEPHESVRRLRQTIASDGHLFLEIPNIASVKAKLQATEWFNLDPRHHVAFYTIEQLRRLLDDCGFELIETTSVSGFSYQRPGRTLRPRELAARVLETAQTKTFSGRPHPWKHELLRAVATPR